MGTAAPVILRVTTPDYGRVTIEASNGMRYYADLSPMTAVYCFPRSKAEWDQVAVDAQGLALVWTTRFEVHVDQVMGLSDRTETIQHSA